MKKISLALVIIILFNFIFNYTVFADNTGNGLAFNQSALYQAEQEGTVEIEGQTKEIKTTQSSVGSVIGIIASPIVAVCTTVSMMLSMVAFQCGFYHTDSAYGANVDGLTKASSIIFGEFLIFNPCITRTVKSMNPTLAASNGLAKVFDGFKTLGVSFFEILRYVAIAIFLILLMLTGLRLAGAVTASDRAKFKSMIVDWLIGMMFVIFAKYVILILDGVYEIIMDALWETRIEMENNGFVSFEFSIFEGITKALIEFGGMRFFAYGVLYALLIIATAKFFISYLFRVFKIIFLVVIAPVAGVLYSIKRVGLKGDNPITSWLGSYVSILFIQPIHALLYLILLFTAGEIAINAPFIGIAFVWAIDRAEKVVRAILGLSQKITIGNK